MTLTNQIAITTYLSQRKDELLKQSLVDWCRQIKTDLGIEVPSIRLSEFEKALGIDRPKGGCADYRKDRIVVLARFVTELAKSLGTEIPVEIKDICIRR
jgi:hypothetical protein